MGFTTPVFILKNTPELRDKLVRLGYKIGYERYINDDFLATDNDEMFGIDVPYPPEQCNGYIHCGTNEALFLAIAALRDDTDDSQWFVYPPENIWFICDDDDINYARENIKDSVQAAWFHCSHKAGSSSNLVVNSLSLYFQVNNYPFLLTFIRKYRH